MTYADREQGDDYKRCHSVHRKHPQLRDSMRQVGAGVQVASPEISVAESLPGQQGHAGSNQQGGDPAAAIHFFV